MRRRKNATNVVASKISGDEIIRTPTAADVHPGSSGAYQIAIGIVCIQETRFMGLNIRLNSPQRALVYKKRCLYRAIISPKSHGTPRSVI
jgi:hypothetical protein